MIIDLPIHLIKLEDQSYHLMMEAVFNSSTPGNLIIDTGASKTIFDREFTQPFIKNIVEIEEENSSGINAMITGAQTGVISSIRFHTFEIEEYPCLTLDLSHVNKVYSKFTDKQIAGLIGSDFLVEHEAVIDYGQQKISLNY